MAVASEQPAEMGLAGGTKHYLPTKTREPGEFAGRLALGESSRCLAKTAQFKGYSRWIEKSVLMLMIHLQRLVPVGDDGTAGRAENIMIGLLFRGVIGAGSRRPGGL